MADTLAREIHLNADKKRTIIALVVVIVVLLLLYWARRGNNTNNNINNITKGSPLGDLLVTPQYINYDVPGIDIPGFNHTGQWDWMQTTDCACDCSCDDRAPATPLTIMTTQYAYIAAPALPAAPQLSFPVLVGPPMPTWWYEPGYNVHHEKARYIYTSDGVTGILGKYSRSAWDDPMHRTSYLQQTKNVTVQGDDAYLNGRHYKHEPRKDKDWPPTISLPSIAYGSVSHG